MRQSPKLHPSITLNRVTEAVMRHNTTLDNPGICAHCGADADGVEPDARSYQCESCGSLSVYGAEELLLTMMA